MVILRCAPRGQWTRTGEKINSSERLWGMDELDTRYDWTPVSKMRILGRPSRP